MAVPYQVQNLSVQQSDSNILLNWNGSLGSTAYNIQRSLDGVNFTDLASTGITTQYVDELPGIGIMYWYKVAGHNSDGYGIYSTSGQMVAAPPSEMSLYELRLRSQQCADRVNSEFVDLAEWNSFIRLAEYELYDLQITAYEDYAIAPFIYINTNGSQMEYELPNGATNFLDGVNTNITGTPSPAFYKLVGVDLGVNTSNNAWVTINRFDYIDRNAYVYPNSTSTIYGVYNMRYRTMGNKLMLIPTPAGNQQLRLTYVPRLAALLRDTDYTNTGISGWLRYVIVRAAKYALDKEQGTDTSYLAQELMFLKQRIEQSSANRDQGQPDTISETRKGSVYGGSGWGSGGGQGGW